MWLNQGNKNSDFKNGMQDWTIYEGDAHVKDGKLHLFKRKKHNQERTVVIQHVNLPKELTQADKRSLVIQGN